MTIGLGENTSFTERGSVEFELLEQVENETDKTIAKSCNFVFLILFKIASPLSPNSILFLLSIIFKGAKKKPYKTVAFSRRKIYLFIIDLLPFPGSLKISRQFQTLNLQIRGEPKDR
jgi:hypothetical protein